MPSKEATTPEVQLRGRHTQESSGHDSQEPIRAPASLHHERPQVNVRRRSPLAAGLFLGMIAFAVFYLVGHVLAAITGYHTLVYVGFGLGVWVGAGALLAFLIGGVCGHDD